MKFSDITSRFKKVPPAQDVAGLVVRDRGNGQLVHSEFFESARMSDQFVADRLVKKREKLEKKYAPSRFDVEGGLFSSKAAFAHFFPDAKIE